MKNNARQTRFPIPRRSGRGRTCTSNRGLTASDAEIVATDRDAVASAARRHRTGERRSRLFAHRLSAPARAEHDATHAFLLAGVRERPARRPRPRSVARRPAPRLRPGRATAPTHDNFPVYFRWQFRTGTIGDFEYLVRLLEPKPVDKTCRRPRPGRAATRARCRASPIPAHQRRAAARRRAARTASRASTTEELAEVERRENWAQPYPHVFQTQPRGADQPGGRTTAHRRAAQANAATGLHRRCWRSGSGDHAAALRALARADPAPAHAIGRHAVADSAQLGARAQSRPALSRAGGIRHARGAVEAGRSDGGRVGSRSATCSRRISACGGLSSRSRSRSSGTRRNSSRCSRRNPAKALTLTAPVHARVMTAAT